MIVWYLHGVGPPPTFRDSQPFLNRGHDELPTQTMHYEGEIPQIDHTFALFDPPPIR